MSYPNLKIIPMKAYGIVYMYRNVMNGKVYVGQTTQPIYRRRREHWQKAFSCNPKRVRYSHFYCALRKYGREAFEETVLFAAFDKQSLDEAEKYFITLYRSDDKAVGYNLKSGGSAGKHTEETKRKIGESSKRLWSKPEHRSHMAQFVPDTSGLRTRESVLKSAAARRGQPRTQRVA